jgi:hypothetical protein
MVKLGRSHRLVAALIDGETEHEVVLLYRDPKTSEIEELERNLILLRAEIPGAQERASQPGELDPTLVVQITKLHREFGAKLLEGAENVEPREGMDIVESIREFEPDLLLILGTHVATTRRRASLPGKSESRSASA